jgi:hypothetical protein
MSSGNLSEGVPMDLGEIARKCKASLKGSSLQTHIYISARSVLKKSFPTTHEQVIEHT